MNQTIEIRISPQGESTITTQGFRGKSCQDASRFLEEALGRTTRESLTGEFYQSEDERTSQQQRE